MPPHSGQGVSQAAEDGYCYAKLLAHEIQKNPGEDYKTAFKVASKNFTTLRKPRIDKILEFAKHGGNNKRNMSWFQEIFRDIFMTLFCKLFLLYFAKITLIQQTKPLI